MHKNVTHCKIVAFETCVNMPSKLCILFDPCKHMKVGVREGQGVFRLFELILTFMKDESFLIATKGMWRIIGDSDTTLVVKGGSLLMLWMT